MGTYQPRSIIFREVLSIDGWKIKVYTISMREEFHHPQFYVAVKKELSKWLFLSNSFNSKNDKIGFLILHSGNEEIFSLINWWIDKHMLNTHIFLSQVDGPTHFTKISGGGLGPCIWELEVINHERISWTNNVLKETPYPSYKKYLEDTINGKI